VVLLTGTLSLAAAPAVPTDPASVEHALKRLTFGPRPGDVDRIQRLGLARWIEEELGPSQEADSRLSTRLSSFRTLTLRSDQIARDYVLPAREARRERLGSSQSPAPVAPGILDGTNPRAGALRGERQVIEELSVAKLVRAVYADRQLHEVLTDFWFNHFNVYAAKGRTSIYITEYEREAIRPHVLGRFRDLLGATARSPAMLFYLDNWLSSDPHAPMASGRRSSAGQSRPGVTTRPPQRARGLNENYARELLELHTLGVDGGYTQNDVTEIARAFTGWTIDPRTQTFRFEPARHDNLPKTVLGHTLDAGGGIRDGERVLDIVASHPATARHIAWKLAQRFVSDDPPAALIDRAGARFRDTDGNLVEVLREIVTSPEFFSLEARGSKIKTPLEFLASALRATGAEITETRPLMRALQLLGMPLYLCQPPTGYDDTANAWVSPGALVNRMNVALGLGHPRARALSVPLSSVENVAALKTRLIRDALGSTVSSSTLTAIDRASTAQQAIALVIGSPEFQRQ
jgi:uncharacterized protein (DUF1800 family)